MTHFSIEIQKNRTDPSKMKQQGKAHSVLQQVEQQKEQPKFQSECMVVQTEKCRIYKVNLRQFNLKNKPMALQV